MFPTAKKRCLRGGWIGVEFFFILSGYLMAREENSIPLVSSDSVGPDTARFILKKVKRLFPYLAFSVVVNFTVWSIPFGGVTLRYLEHAISGLLNFIFAFSAGFPSDAFFYLGYSWYISAMILCMLLLFPLLHKNRKMFNCIYAPLIVLFGMGLFAFKYRGVGFVSSKDWVLSNGILRASFGLSLGCLSYVAAEKLQSYNFTRFGEKLLSVLLLIGTAVVSYRIIFLDANSINDFLLIFLLAAIVTIAFSEKSAIHFSLGTRAGNFLGNFSYALYITSNCWSYLVARMFPDWPYQKALIVYLVLAILCAFACMAVCFIIGKLFSKVKEPLKSLIIIN